MALIAVCGGSASLRQQSLDMDFVSIHDPSLTLRAVADRMSQAALQIEGRSIPIAIVPSFAPPFIHQREMKRIPNPSYRVLFWMAMVIAAIASTAWLYCVQRLGDCVQKIGDPRYYDPHRVSELRNVSYPFTIEIYGYKYHGKTGDYIDDHVLAYGAYEKDVLHFMRDYLRARHNPDAVFLDVGACEGQHSLFVSRLVKQVHAFEPYPPVADRFRKMIELNEFSNIELHEVGLGDKEAQVPFYAPADDNIGGGSFLAGRADERVKPIGTFRVVVGDQWLDQLNVSSIELIKIDVEGYEGLVLAGLASTLRRNRPVVVVEVSPPAKGTVHSLEEFARLLPENYAYLYFLNDRRCAITGQYRLIEMRHLPSGPSYEMVVAYPKERESLILQPK
jgi:FkbM family methyltransferase